MSKVFYCGGASGRLGMLRAVVPLADLGRVLSVESFSYVGHAFPELKPDSAPCTLIEVSADEEQGNWKAGFYRVDKRPLEFEDSLRARRLIDR